MRSQQLEIRKLWLGFRNLIGVWWALRPVATGNLFLCATAVAILCNCGPSARNAASPFPPIRVAAFYWPGTYWIGIAAAKGWFREAGLNVQLVDCNADYSGSEKDLVEGRLDSNTFVLFDLLDYIAQGAVLVGIINADYSAGSEKLIARAADE